MRSILEELWYGNVCPSEGCRGVTKETKELMTYREIVSWLLQTKTDDQMEGGKPPRDCGQSLRPYRLTYNSALCILYSFALHSI